MRTKTNFYLYIIFMTRFVNCMERNVSLTENNKQKECPEHMLTFSKIQFCIINESHVASYRLLLEIITAYEM